MVERLSSSQTLDTRGPQLDALSWMPWTQTLDTLDALDTLDPSLPLPPPDSRRMACLSPYAVPGTHCLATCDSGAGFGVMLTWRNGLRTANVHLAPFKQNAPTRLDMARQLSAAARGTDCAVPSGGTERG
eukprot:496129-Rhodomonas_salina.1